MVIVNVPTTPKNAYGLAVAGLISPLGCGFARFAGLRGGPGTA